MVVNMKWKPNWASSFLHKTDAWLFEQACQGDEKAAHQLVAKLSPRAHSLAWRMLGDSSEAQDVVQEGFIKLFQSKQFEGASALATYFYVIVTRLCLDRMRVNRAVRFDLSEELQDLLEDESQNPFKDLQAAQSSSLIQKAMMSIKPRQRAVLTLWAYQDATMSEIAEMMELEVNAVHQLLHRAKINLREKLEGLGYETS
jgi:RNA polymerase sigma-70 factor, ECF subfamily